MLSVSDIVDFVCETERGREQVLAPIRDKTEF